MLYALQKDILDNSTLNVLLVHRNAPEHKLQSDQETKRIRSDEISTVHQVYLQIQVQYTIQKF